MVFVMHYPTLKNVLHMHMDVDALYLFTDVSISSFIVVDKYGFCLCMGLRGLDHSSHLVHRMPP